MKKSFLTLFVLSFFFTACNDNDAQKMAEKLQKAEKTIATLNTQLAQAEQKIANAEQHTIQEIEKASAKASKVTPWLQVEIEPLFFKQDKVKVKEEGENERELVVFYFTSRAKTGVEWLDHLLLEQLGEKSSKSLAEKEKALIKTQEDAFQQSVAELKEMGGIVGHSFTTETSYVGQLGKIATFSFRHNTYTGGAHGMYYTDFLNVDLEKNVAITLERLISKEKIRQFKKLLWENYISDPERKEWADEMVKEADFEISEQFYIDDIGVTFVYPPYALGPFAAGVIELTLSWYEINTLIAPEYQRTKKDGFELMPEGAIF